VQIEHATGIAKVSLCSDRRYKRSDGTFPTAVKVSVAAQKSFLISSDIDIPDENRDDRSKRIVGNDPRDLLARIITRTR